MNDNSQRDPRLLAIPDTHGHCKGEHKPYTEERPLPLTARMLFLWFYHACRRGYPRFLMVADHMNYLTFEDPAAVNLVRRALKLAQAGDLYGAAETANVDVAHAAVVGEGLRRGMRFSIGAEVDNDPRSRPDAQNIVDAMKPDAIIRSIHFLPITHPVHGENWQWPFDNPEFVEFYETVGTAALWELYMTAVLDAIERLPGHILGHFYVPAAFGHWPDDAKLQEYEDRMLDAAAARGMAVEFNTRFLYRDHPDEEKHRYLAVNKRLLRKAKERNVGIAIGSDAHSPRDQGNMFDLVLDVLDELEINEIVFPLAGRLARVALKVERKPEPEPAPPPPPPEPPAKPAKVAKPTRDVPVADEGIAAAPVRKARETAKPSRTPERGHDRPAEREDAPATGAAPETAESAPPPAAPKKAPKAAAKPAPAPKPAPAAKPAPPAAKPVATPKAAPAPKAPPVKAAAASKAAPAKGKTAPVPPAAQAKRVPAKAAAAKPAPKPAAKPKTAPAAKPPAKKAAAAKPAAKKAAAARPAPKKAAPAKKAAAQKKAVAKRPAPKKAAPARPAAKKPAPKKAPAKKAAPARSAPARKAPAAKKSTKKTATKRR